MQQMQQESVTYRRQHVEQGCVTWNPKYLQTIRGKDYIDGFMNSSLDVFDRAVVEESHVD